MRIELHVFPVDTSHRGPYSPPEEVGCRPKPVLDVEVD